MSTVSTATAAPAAPGSAQPTPDACAICLDPIAANDAKFTSSCQHTFHVQCIEARNPRNVVAMNGRGALNLSCPMCRAPWTWAPGVVAMGGGPPSASAPVPAPAPAPAEPAPPPPAAGGSLLGWVFRGLLGVGRSGSARGGAPAAPPPPPLYQQQVDPGLIVQQRRPSNRGLNQAFSQRISNNFVPPPSNHDDAGRVLFPDVPLAPRPAPAAAAAAAADPAAPAPRLQLDALGPGWCTVSAVTDFVSVPAGRTSDVTAIVKVAFADDDARAPFTTPTDFVLVADVSGSMSGAKIDHVHETLLKVSDMFNANDRVCLVKFESYPTQLTPLAQLSVPAHEGQFRSAAMEHMSAGGGTDIAGALALALDILEARRTRNPLAHILVLSDGEDKGAYRSLDALVQRSQALPGGAAAISTFGYGADHDAELLSTFAARGKGTFSFVEDTALLDELFASFMGDATSIAAQAAEVEVAPAEAGVTIARVQGPGAVAGPDAAGAFRIALQHAAVAATRQVLVKFSVAVPADAAAGGGAGAGGAARRPALRVTASGLPPGAPAGARRVEAEPCAVSLAVVAAGASPEQSAGEQLVEVQSAVNRETVAAAAAEVARIISSGRGAADAERAIAEAEARIVGDTGGEPGAPGSQTGYVRELQQLRSRMASDASPAHAYGVTQVLQMQRTVDFTRVSAAPTPAMSKYATQKHREMVTKKSAPAGPSSAPPPRGI